MTRSSSVLFAAILVVLWNVSFAPAQDPAFTGVGQLPAGTGARCIGISQDGTVAVGDAVAEGKTQAFLWTAGGGLRGIGFLSQINQESHATDVGVTSTGQIKICGYSKDDSNKNQAFLWTGDATGTGTFELIARLGGGTANEAYGLYITDTDDVLVTGDSECLVSGSIRKQGFYWQPGEPDSEAIGFLNGGTPDSHGRGIGFANGKATIVGYGNSKWSAGNNSREGLTYVPARGDLPDILPDKGLAWVCGRGWQIVAGPNGVADTLAVGNDSQVTPVGPDVYTPTTVVVSTGPDNILDTEPTSDDVKIPTGSNPLDPDDPEYRKAESLYRAVSPDGRFRVGRSTYGGTDLFEAHLRDPRNRDYASQDQCGGIAFHWPLGFLTLNNDGSSASDNYSEAWGVSNSTSSTGRNGLVVVGWSSEVGGTATHQAFICMVTDSLDLWFLRHGGADPDDYGAHAASRFKDMRNLQWLLSNDFGLDLTGWDLREALAVSDDGTVVVGWGLHNGVEEGFTAVVPGLPPLGACCVTTGFSTGTCTETIQVECNGDWLGPDTTCGPDGANCDFCFDPFADTDGDTDVDMVDFALLQTCITTGGGPVTDGCSCFDTDDSDAIDEVDVERFILCGSGPDVPASTACDDGF